MYIINVFIQFDDQYAGLVICTITIWETRGKHLNHLSFTYSSLFDQLLSFNYFNRLSITCSCFNNWPNFAYF